MMRFFLKNDLENKIDWFYLFRFPHKRAIVRWLLFSLKLFIVVGIVVSLISYRMYRQARFWQSQAIKSEQALEKVQLKAASKASSRTVNKNLKKEYKNLNECKKKHEALLMLLSGISRLIPENTWLTRFTCEKNNRKSGRRPGGKQKPLLKMKLDGFSANYQEVISFYSSLARLKLLQHCCLKYDQQGSYKLKFSIMAEIMV